MLRIGNDRVRHRPLASALGGHIPSAPALTHRTFLTSDERSRSAIRRTIRLGKNRPQHHAGYALGGWRHVALDAIHFGSFKPGMLVSMLVHHVENGALHGVEGDKLQEPSVMHLADVNVIVVIERARRGWVNFWKLKTGLGKDQGLRTYRNMQCVED